VSRLRLLAWNCHHGALDARLAEVAALSPDIAFVHEWRPSWAAPPPANAVVRQVKKSKGVALAAINPEYTLAEIPRPRGATRAAVAAVVTGPMSFNTIGIWAQGPNYAADMMKSIKAFAKLIRSGPTVVMGDFNSGSKLHGAMRVTKGHPPIVDAFDSLGLVSAYHAFHKVDHGQETHATYRHLFKASQPWHLDFCFVPVAWADRIRSVDVLHDDVWAKRSDHAAIVVELHLPAPATA
jgi:endonuclease/exonuclease/phosphatase family metal-dependent hydrolase